MAWVDDSEQNMAHLKTLRQMFDITLWTAGHAQVPSEEKTIEAGTVKRARVISLLREAGKVAAIALIAVVCTLFFLQRDSDVIGQQDLYAARGQRAELILADGTHVWLNSNSHLYVPTNYSPRNRQVRVDGEVFFNVKKDERHPFIVSTDKYNVKVLGTQFNVKAYSQLSTWETALEEGKVEIYDHQLKHALVTLEPGTRAVLKDGKIVKETINDENSYLWRRGIIAFSDQTLSEIIPVLEQYYGMKFNVVNRKLLSQRYTGKFRVNEGLRHILHMLLMEQSLTLSIDDDNHVVTIR